MSQQQPLTIETMRVRNLAALIVICLIGEAALYPLSIELGYRRALKEAADKEALDDRKEIWSGRIETHRPNSRALSLLVELELVDRSTEELVGRIRFYESASNRDRKSAAWQPIFARREPNQAGFENRFASHVPQPPFPWDEPAQFIVEGGAYSMEGHWQSTRDPEVGGPVELVRVDDP